MDFIASMRIFTHVIEGGSFSAAARQLGVAPSSISRQVSELEYDLGARLFYRSTRKLSLTEAGQQFYERAKQILLDVEDTRLALAQSAQTPSGILRVTVPTIARNRIATTLPSFLADHPAVHVVLSMTDKVVDILEDGVDLAIRIGRQRDSGLIARKIGSSKRLVCANPDYLQRVGTPRHPKELEAHNCLTFRTQPGKNVWRFRGPDGQAEARVCGSLFADNAELLATAASEGLGLILLPDLHLTEALQDGRLVPVLEEYRAIPEESPFYAVYPHQKHLPPKVRAYIDFLVATFDSSNP